MERYEFGDFVCQQATLAGVFRNRGQGGKKIVGDVFKLYGGRVGVRFFGNESRAISAI